MAPATASPAVNELVRQFNTGFTIEPSGDGHYFVLNSEGEKVRTGQGLPITIAGTPHQNGHAWQNMRRALRVAGVIESRTKHKPRKPGETNEQLLLERSESELRGEDRVRETRALYERFYPLFKKAGGIERIKSSDMARVGAFVWNADNPTHIWRYEDALAATSTLLGGKAMFGEEINYLTPLVERLESAPDPRAEWFMLLRETLGLDQATALPGKEWPFKVILVPLTKLFPEEEYQRPVEEDFVRKLTLTFDERLVGSIDVSAREDGRYAIIDGLQRVTAMIRIGKTHCYCAVYEGLSLAEEATLFFHKNRDRKQVHPYYHYRARLVAGDPSALAIEQIVKKAGFKLDPAGAKAGTASANHITGIRGVEE